MSVKTIEKVTHTPTPTELDGLLHVKWTGGRELLRNSAKFAGKEGWEPASTVGTRVIYDTEWEEYCVYVYINEKRYFPADHHETDKSEALAVARNIRSGDSFGVKAELPKLTWVDVWFDSYPDSPKLWTILSKTRDNEQIGDASYASSKKEALALAKKLAKEQSTSSHEVTVWAENRSNGTYKQIS